MITLNIRRNLVIIVLSFAQYLAYGGLLDSENKAKQLQFFSHTPALELPTTIYVSTSGSDSAGDGSLTNPFASLLRAINETTSGKGDTIKLSAGEYVETQRLYIPSDVKLIGAGSDQTLVKVNHFYDITSVPRFNANGLDQGFDPAPQEGVIQLNGQNHLFQGIAFDGQSDQSHACFIADTLINSVFDDVFIYDFNFTGLWVQTAINLEIKNSKFLNNAFGYTVRCSADLMFLEGSDISIHDNEIIENSGDGAYNMMILNQNLDAFFGYCHGVPELGRNPVIRDVEVYNNVLEVERQGAWRDGLSPALTMNMIGSNLINWNIHHNWINNIVSLVALTNRECGGYQYPSDEKVAWVHHNVFELRKPNGSLEYRYGIEASSSNLEIDHNYFLGGNYPIASWEADQPSWWRNHNIHHNVFFHPRSDLPLLTYKDYPENFRFDNNTVVDTTSIGISEYFRLLKVADSAEVFVPASAFIRNNMFLSLGLNNQKEGMWKPENFDNPVAVNNLFYSTTSFGEDFINVSDSLDPSSILTMLDSINYHNNYANYSQVFDFAGLASGSPAIDAGVEIGHYSRGAAPDLGAFESGSGNLKPSVHIVRPFPGVIPLVTDTIKIVIDALDVDGILQQVQLYNDTILLEDFTSPPYEYTISSASPPGYSFVVKAVDDLGAVSISDTLYCKVKDQLRVNGTQGFIRSYDEFNDTGYGASSPDRKSYFMSGNVSKRVETSYSKTSNTVLEFEFKSMEEGLNHRIGVEMNDGSVSWYQIYGTDSVGVQDFHNYSDTSYIYYTIPLGDSLQGQVVNILLENKALNQTASCFFKDIALVERLGETKWLSRDIGDVGLTGNASEIQGYYKINAAGKANFKFSKEDAFHYIHQRVEGDFTLIAKLESLEEIRKWTRGGLMVREDVDDDSKMFLHIVSPDGNSILWRNEKGGDTDRQGTTSWMSPVWLKVTRVGNIIKSYQSLDGQSWTTSIQRTISMNSTVNVGFIAASDNTGILAELVYKNVNLASGLVTNNPPTISISSPDTTFLYESGSSMTIAVEATDLDTGIEAVQIFIDSDTVATLSTSPFTHTFSETLSDGVHQLTALVYDLAGFYSVESLSFESYTPASSFNIFEDSVDMIVDSVFQLAYTITPANATNSSVLWTSSDRSVSVVDSIGVVSAVGIGEAWITGVAVDNGLKDSVLVSSSVVPSVFSLNQRQNGGVWNSIGVFDFRSSETDYIKIKNDGSNGYVVADAIRLTKEGADTIIIDNSNSRHVGIHGDWTQSTAISGYWLNDYLVIAKDQLNKSVTFYPFVPESGEWHLSVRWTSYPNRATNAKLEVLATGQVLQSGYSLVSPTYGANYLLDQEILIYTDALDATSVEYYVNEVLLGVSNSEPFTYTWLPDSAGTFILKAKISMDSSERFTDIVLINVWSEEIPNYTVIVNQKTNGGIWNDLGTYNFSGSGNEYVRIRTDNTNGYVLADAFKFIKIGGEEEVILDSEDSSGVAIAGNWINTTAIQGFQGSSAKHDDNIYKGERSVTYYPSLSVHGEWKVLMRYPSYPNRASNVPVDIYATGGFESGRISSGNDLVKGLEDLKIFPNPVEDILSIQGLEQGKAYKVTIFNTAGQQVLKRHLTSQKAFLNLSELKTGIYLAAIDNAGKNIKFRIIKK